MSLNPNTGAVEADCNVTHEDLRNALSNRLPDTGIDVQQHVLYALRNAVIKNWPFPHFYVENVFPSNFYQLLLHHLKHNVDFHAQGDLYKGRAFGKTHALLGLDFLQTPEFLQSATFIFRDAIRERYKDKKCVVYSDVRLVRDSQGYSIGPHTDAAWKLVSLLFYLPATCLNERHGTSLYLPKDRNARCPGGPHHNVDQFDRVATMPFRTNSCFGFFKTDNSFHGVEPVTAEFRRDVLLYNIYDQELYLRAHPKHIPPPTDIQPESTS